MLAVHPIKNVGATPVPRGWIWDYGFFFFFFIMCILRVDTLSSENSFWLVSYFLQKPGFSPQPLSVFTHLSLSNIYKSLENPSHIHFFVLQTLAQLPSNVLDLPGFTSVAHSKLQNPLLLTEMVKKSLRQLDLFHWEDLAHAEFVLTF